MLVRSLKGFTILEILVAVFIVSILATVAQPFFTEAQKKTSRVDVQTKMLTIADDLNTFKVQKGTFAGSNILGSSNKIDFPGENPIYEIALTVSNSTDSRLLGVGYVLTATPKTGTRMSSDGVVCLNHLGQTYWVKGATTCDLTATSNWHGG